MFLHVNVKTVSFLELSFCNFIHKKYETLKIYNLNIQMRKYKTKSSKILMSDENRDKK